VLILKALHHLFSYDDVLEELPMLQYFIDQIVLNLHMYNVEVSALVLEILT
jgi:hypothetical protein